MENQHYINFKRERELGEILSDTFGFVRINYRILSQLIFKLVGPVILILLLASSGYMYLVSERGFSIFSLIEKNNSFLNTESFFGLSGLVVLVVILISALFYAILFATINFSIKSYIQNDGNIKAEEVTLNVKQTWGSFLGLACLAGVIVMVGLMFCILPGIYFYVPMSLVFSIMVFHQMGISKSISYSFKLIKSNWWMSFFTLLIMGVIYYLTSAIFQLPAAIYTLVKTMTVSKEISISSGDASGIIDWVYILLSLIGSLASYVLFVFMVICSSFIYFNLNEKKNQTGTFESIDSLGAEN